jgi:hypothetical protein
LRMSFPGLHESVPIDVIPTRLVVYRLSRPPFVTSHGYIFWLPRNGDFFMAKEASDE